MKTSVIWTVHRQLGAAFIVVCSLIAPTLSHGQDISTDLISYWPLDEIDGAGKSPDAFGTFDMQKFLI